MFISRYFSLERNFIQWSSNGGAPEVSSYFIGHFLIYASTPLSAGIISFDKVEPPASFHRHVTIKLAWFIVIVGTTWILKAPGEITERDLVSG